MRFIFLFIFATAFCFYSCDDGDIIVTDFDFDEVDLDLCETTTDNYIYFKINSDTREGISFNFTQEDFSETTVTEDGPIVIPVNSDNQFTYRRFNTAIGQDYYCGILPPSTVTVEEEFVGTSGTASITTSITDEDDGDGLEETRDKEDKNYDTDGDGIPNYKDQDDDNDNVPTSAELGENGTFLFTDDDMLPDHLDPDDDGDTIPTKYEEGPDPNGDPRDDRRPGSDISNYLDDTIKEEGDRTAIDAFVKTNSVITTFETIIIFDDLIINGLDQSIVEENLRLFGTREQNRTIMKDVE